MSPVNRDRKSKKGKTHRPSPPYPSPALQECDCPECSGTDFDPQQLIDELIAGAADLVESEDPVDAEVAAAAFVAIGAMVGEEFEEALVSGFIPEFEATASSPALALLLAIGSVAPGRAGKAASVAADRLIEAGVAPPGWVGELSEPVTVADCWRLSDPQCTGSMLAFSFQRAGRSHAVMMSVDHTDCGAAGDILLLDADVLPEALTMTQDSGLQFRTERLDPAELRWQVENALDARAVHDSDGLDEDMTDLPVDEDGPGYPALAVLLRSRMTALPVPSKSAARHGDTYQSQAGLPVLQILAQLAGSPDSPFGTRTPITRRGRAVLPAKRTKSDQPAPIPTQGGPAGRDATDLAAPGSPRRHQPSPGCIRSSR